MKIVRDNEMNGVLMIPLWTQYGLHRCNVRDCRNKQTTIVLDFPGSPPFALCEDHYNKAKEERKLECTLDFDPLPTSPISEEMRTKAVRLMNSGKLTDDMYNLCLKVTYRGVSLSENELKVFTTL